MPKWEFRKTYWLTKRDVEFNSTFKNQIVSKMHMKFAC